MHALRSAQFAQTRAAFALFVFVCRSKRSLLGEDAAQSMAACFIDDLPTIAQLQAFLDVGNMAAHRTFFDTKLPGYLTVRHIGCQRA
jgi:hypothetical protein